MPLQCTVLRPSGSDNQGNRCVTDACKCDHDECCKEGSVTAQGSVNGGASQDSDPCGPPRSCPSQVAPVKEVRLDGHENGTVGESENSDERGCEGREPQLGCLGGARGETSYSRDAAYQNDDRDYKRHYRPPASPSAIGRINQTPAHLDRAQRARDSVPAPARMMAMYTMP